MPSEPEDSVRALFDAGADAYDGARRRLVPCFDDFYRTAVELIPFESDAPLRVLDLGAGTGLLSAMIADAYPRATLTLVDLSPAMLALARERFAGSSHAVRFEILDYATTPIATGLDVVVSALSIHHLEDEQKQSLYRRCFEAIEPGGAFINADQVAGPTPALTRAYLDTWRRQVRAAGGSEDELRQGEERMRADRPAPLESQLAWLRAAGFRDVDCFYKHYMFAVFAGFR
ncbi:MAG TPA: methyltransferase domain-containing protein [Chloroflexota bacterium]|nr:methyltransferase domain-containing protein [Chloroflexota bacterium]